MSDAGAPSFPQPGQYRPEGNQRSFNSDFRVGNLERAPNEIRAEITAERKAIRLDGEITRVNQDGSVRIATERGDVDVRLTADERHQQRPQVGQRVEIEVQPAPRNTPEAAPSVTLRPAPTSVETQQPQARVSSTPVQVEVREGQTAQTPRADAQIVRPEQIDRNAPPPRNTFPEAGTLIRLDPVAPEQLEQLIQTRQVIVAEVVRNSITPLPVLETLPPLQGQQPTAPITAQAIAQPSAVNTAIQAAVSPEILPQTQNTQAAPILQQPQATQVFTEPVQQVVLPAITPPVLNTPFTQNAQMLETQITVPVLTRVQAAVAQIQTAAASQPIVETPSSPAPVPQDARMANIQQPQVSLVPPNTDTPDLQIQHAPPAPVIGSQKAAQITGTVIAKTEAQVPILQFSVPQSIGTPQILNAPLNALLSPVQQQTFILQFPSDALILGSRIDVTPQSFITTSATQNALPTTPQALPVLPFANIAFPQSWPVMTEIQQTLTQQTTQAAAQTAQAFTSVLPSPANAAQFGPAALFFIAAVRGGDMGSWLGDKASELLRQSGKGDLLSRLTGEGAPLSRSDAPPGEWRGMNIPLFWDGDIKQIILHYKHDHSDDSQEQSESNKGTRFVFDLNLDVMGKVQLDGFFRPVSSVGPRLDVVLRTEERFSGAVQAEMRRIYMDAIKPSQVGGELSFQDGADAWVMIDAQSDNAVGVSA